MPTKLAWIAASLLTAVLAACSQGYTPERGDGTGGGYHGSYQGGANLPAVMPGEQDRLRGD